MFGLTEQSRLGFTGLIIFQIILMNLSRGLACSSNDRSTTNICSTLACEQTATFLLASIDERIDPCSNFYKFACGNFLKKSVLLQNMPAENQYDQMQIAVQKQLRSSIENGITDNDPRAFKLLKSFFDACMNKDQIEKNSVVEFVGILDKLGGWPVLAGESWNETTFDWRSLMLKFRGAGFRFDQFLNVYITKNTRDNRRKSVFVDRAALGLPQEDLAHTRGFTHEMVRAYFNYMVEFVVQLGVERERAVEELGPALDLEIKLAKISLASDQHDQFDESMSIAKLQESYPFPNNGLNWHDYFNGILQPHDHVRDDDIVVVESPIYLESLFKLLEETPKRVQANYAFWSVAMWAAELLGDRINQVRREFPTVTQNTEKEIGRWQYCFNKANGQLHLAMEVLYVKMHVPKETKESATELIVDVIRSFKKMMEEVNWMDETTKKYALEKLDAMKLVVAYPDVLVDYEKLNDYYDGLQIYPESYLRTSLSLNLFQMERVYEKLGKPDNRADWTSHVDVLSFNAKYIHHDNTIFFPAGLLQGKFSDKNTPQFMKYASLGSTVGYEMMFGFNVEGRLFDKDGNLVIWWSDNTNKEYLERIRCLVEQYQIYTLKTFNLTLNDENIEGAKLTDMSGVKESYYAYEAWQKRNAPEPSLPGLEKYSPRQLFWMSYTSLWCANHRQEYLEDLDNTSHRTPTEYRINNLLSNIPEFARDFNCPKDSPMNPEKRCPVW